MLFDAVRAMSMHSDRVKKKMTHGEHPCIPAINLLIDLQIIALIQFLTYKIFLFSFTMIQWHCTHVMKLINILYIIITNFYEWDAFALGTTQLPYAVESGG